MKTTGKPRKDFFLFVHADEEHGDDELPIDYFLTASGDRRASPPEKKNATGAFYESRLARKQRLLST